MTYELLKQLKDAGFPQDTVTTDKRRWLGRNYIAPDGNAPIYYGESIPYLMGEKQWFFYPTLSEQWSDEWVASQETFYDDAGYQGIVGKGTSPEIAVARLWLALNAVPNGRQ